MARAASIGLDYGTNSVRALVVELSGGRELATSVFSYPSGRRGVIQVDGNPALARQHPADWLSGAESAISDALERAQHSFPDFAPEDVVGLGVDATGSTPIPVAAEGTPLAFQERFRDNVNALGWLWKDHTAVAEAEEITREARRARPHYLAPYGGVYSSEWYWAKLLRCARIDPKLFGAAESWVEACDWVPARLCGIDRPDRIVRSICAAGHKALYSEEWGGFPDADFLGSFDAELVRIRSSLPERCYSAAERAGTLCGEWAKKTGLPAGIPVAVGAFDAHLGGVGAGVKPGVMVKSIGTSTCDVLVRRVEEGVPEIPGLCGVVRDSVLPGAYGLEAGQSAVGDILDWFVNTIQPGGAGSEGGSEDESETGSASGPAGHEELTAGAQRLAPGESGLLALDWHNGNRSILVDGRLTGMIAGLTLQTRPPEIYRALVEATAFGARTIMERFEEYGIPVERIIACGGIAYRNAMLMQIYADVLARPLTLSRSEQTAALGSAVAGAVVAGRENGGYERFEEGIAAMTGTLDTVYEPVRKNVAIYNRLYSLYRDVHDAFGAVREKVALSRLMKELIRIRDEHAR